MIDRNQIGEEILTEEQEIYQENILDHYKHPRNVGLLPQYTHCHRELNHLCGDELEVFLQISGKRTVEKIAFRGQGCAISQAAMSMLSDHIKGKHIKEILQLKKDDIITMLGIPIGIVRLKCALLGLKTVQQSLRGMPS